MSYIGNDLQVAASRYRIIDDISSGFNGSETSFRASNWRRSASPFPVNAQQCLISVNGVIQEPDPTGSAGFNLVEQILYSVLLQLMDKRSLELF